MRCGEDAYIDIGLLGGVVLLAITEHFVMLAMSERLELCCDCKTLID